MYALAFHIPCHPSDLCTHPPTSTGTDQYADTARGILGALPPELSSLSLVALHATANGHPEPTSIETLVDETDCHAAFALPESAHSQYWLSEKRLPRAARRVALRRMPASECGDHSAISEVPPGWVRVDASDGARLFATLRETDLEAIADSFDASVAGMM